VQIKPSRSRSLRRRFRAGMSCNDTNHIDRSEAYRRNPIRRRRSNSDLFPNLGFCVGNDVISKPLRGDPFSLVSGSGASFCRANFNRFRTFAPKDAIAYADTIRVQRFIKETNKTCTATIISGERLRAAVLHPAGTI